MSELPGDLVYTKEHEWLRQEEDGSVTIGVTDHAQAALGDLVYVELPEVDQDVERGGEFGGTIEEAVTETLEAYKEAARGYLPTADVRGLPGAIELVERFHNQDDVQLGLLTGNVREMAYLKLSQISLDEFFPFGAFGCDAEERNHLPQFAVDRAAKHTGRTFSGKDVIVIGDTPRDIECGKLFGATTVGVATGHFTVDELAEHEPDVVLETLEEFRIP